MKLQKKIIYLMLVFAFVFTGITIFTFYQSNKLIENGYLSSEGKAAEDFAVLTASNIHLSDAQVAKLKSYTYKELLNSKENKQLQEMMSNENFESKVDYAYLMIRLKKEEVKYTVNKTNQHLFDVPTGTPLDIMWLLDVNVSEQANQAASVNHEETADIQRYSYYQKKDANIFRMSPTYIFNDSEWGKHICGYSPIYTTEGTYIGVIGVELQVHDYNSYRSGALWAMAALLCVTTVTLILLFFILYRRYRKLQFEKIYTDSLTHIYNRSYYNDQFIKRMNMSRLHGHYFALMICDIDWFKKVNDTFGHEIGDQVLIEVALLIQETFGKNHVVRFGGEEFVAGIWVDDIQDLRLMIDQLFDRMRANKFSSQEIDLSLSLGCCFAHDTQVSGWLLSEMLKTADHNLYDAKENGRKQYRISKYETSKSKE